MVLDVLLPCRNAPGVLAMTLAHLNAYGHSAGLVRSVTVLDNDSHDPGMEPLLARVSHWPRYTVVRYGENVGVWCSLNRGLATIRGDVPVLVLTADVLLGPDTIPTLLGAYQQLRRPFLGPDWVIGTAEHWRTVAVEDAGLRDTYNGACWLMDWPVLRETVGGFDPRFYVCCGDTDYVQRLHDTATRTGDTAWLPIVVGGLCVTHLDRQSRRADADAQGDSDMEVRDLLRLHRKYEDRPDVLAAHPLPNAAMLAAVKDKQGWR